MSIPRAVAIEISGHAFGYYCGPKRSVMEVLRESGLDLTGCRVENHGLTTTGPAYADNFLFVVFDPAGRNEWLPPAPGNGEMLTRVDLFGLRRLHMNWLVPEQVLYA